MAKAKSSRDIKWYLKNIQRIKDGMRTLNDDRIEAIKFYEGSPEIVEFMKGRSKLTTSDLQDAIEWVKPSLMEIFAGGDEVVSLQPGQEEDVANMERMQLLVNQQIKVKNSWFIIVNDWIDNALLMKTGAVKYQWFKETTTIDKDYEGLTEAEYQAKVAEKDSEVLSEEPHVEPGEFGSTTTYDLSIRKTIEDEYPLIESVPAEDVGFDPRAREIAKVPFMYHKIRYQEYEFIKLYGAAKAANLKKKSNEIAAKDDDVTRKRLEDLGGQSFYWDDKKDEYIVYECYFFDSKTGDPRIGTICGNEILDEIANKYRKPPFHIITPIKLAHRIAGKSLYDLLKEIQKIRTALLRQIFDNLYFSNNRRYFGDPERVNVDDYLNNNFPGSFVRTEGDPRTVIMPEEKAPLPPEVFQFWEMMNIEKDYHSGVPRSFQGVNPNILNKTWRGQNQQVSQASQRVSMMARLIAEMGVSPLMQDIVDLNIRFLKKKTSIRYLNTWVDINPDNIIGKYDSIVNVGIGTGDKAQIIMYIQQLLGIYQQIFKTGIPIVTPDNVYKAVKELIKAMGFRNTGDFVTDPKLTQAIAALLSALASKGIIGQDPQITQIAQMIAGQMGLLPKQNQKPQNPAEAGAEENPPGGATPTEPTLPANPMEPTMPSQGDNLG